MKNIKRHEKIFLGELIDGFYCHECGEVRKQVYSDGTTLTDYDGHFSHVNGCPESLSPSELDPDAR